MDLAYYEILILLIPALMVFLAVYFLFRQFFQNQLKMEAFKARQEDSKVSRELKLRAYERLMLFAERISIPNLLLRLQSRDMSMQDLRSSLILAVQQEYEHNLSQQLYVSDKLWSIIHLAKDQLIEIITHVAAQVPAGATAQDFSNQLILFSESQTSPVETAKKAIKKESSLLL